ncbi:MAG: hypothetical protein OHK0012_14830 [Synechococcales cyanobacterium]
MPIPRLLAVVLGLSLGCVVPSGIAQAIGTDEPPPEDSVTAITFQKGKKALATEDWLVAIPLFQSVVAAEPDNADAWNYLAYSHRRSGQLTPAFNAYRKALTLNPQHLGALSYLGEAYLQAGDIDQAQAQLQKLALFCGTTCTEYQALAEAIATHTGGSPSPPSTSPYKIDP